MIRLGLVDVLGQHIVRLRDELTNAGYRFVMWNDVDVARGVYLYRF